MKIAQIILDRAASQAALAAEACAQPFWPGERIISRRHPLFEAETVTRCYQVAPGVWRVEWRGASRLGRTPSTGSGPADAYRVT